MSDENRTPPDNEQERALWLMGYSKEERDEILNACLKYPMDPVMLGQALSSFKKVKFFD